VGQLVVVVVVLIEKLSNCSQQESAAPLLVASTSDIGLERTTLPQDARKLLKRPMDRLKLREPISERRSLRALWYKIARKLVVRAG
jgi:hypothetical protein